MRLGGHRGSGDGFDTEKFGTSGVCNAVAAQTQGMRKKNLRIRQRKIFRTKEN